MKLIDKLFYFFALPLLVLIAIAALSRPSTPRPETVLSPQDIIYQRMGLLKSLVRDTAKDPGSIEFLQEYYSDSTSCVVYTGTNGFGARVKGVASLHDGQFSTSQKTFDKVCK